MDNPGKVSDLFGAPIFSFTANCKGDKDVNFTFVKGKDDFYVLKLADRDDYFKVNSLPVESFTESDP